MLKNSEFINKFKIIYKNYFYDLKVILKNKFNLFSAFHNFVKYLIFDNKKINLFLCLNNYSFYLAESLILQRKNNCNFVFFDKKRSKIKEHQFYKIYLTYNYFFNRFFLYICCFLVEDKNIFIPHTKGGRIQRSITKNFRFSILDDGLDSFREIPQNIKIELLYEKTVFLLPAQFKMFNAKWIKSFINEYFDIDPLILLPVNESKMKDHITHFEGENILTIESPGVDICVGFDKSNYLLPHPSLKKNFLKSNFHAKILTPEQATFFIRNINKNINKIFVGETLILVYLLNTIENHPKRYLEVGLKKKSYKNLNPLIQRFLNHPRINFYFD